MYMCMYMYMLRMGQAEKRIRKDDLPLGCVQASAVGEMRCGWWSVSWTSKQSRDTCVMLSVQEGTPLVTVGGRACLRPPQTKRARYKKGELG